MNRQADAAIRKRVSEALRATGKPVWQLARELKAHPNSVTSWLDERVLPRGESIYKISQVCGVSIEWLIAGREKDGLSKNR